MISEPWLRPRRRSRGIASLIETTKLNSVDPQVYLAEVPSRLVDGWPMCQIDDLMLWTYAVPQSTRAVA
jgi:transposase